MQPFKEGLVITGACGYIGSVLSRILPNKNVTLIDRLDYGSEGLKTWKAKLIKDDFANYDVGEQTLVHLASPRLDGKGFASYVETSKKLFETAKSKIIFASSCSVYENIIGLGHEDMFIEPTSDYAKSKLELETEVLKRNGIVLRFATAYGDSPVPRNDLMINNFVAISRLKDGDLQVFNPQALRPFAHVHDIAYGIVWSLSAPSGIYNIGGENWRKGEIARHISEVTGCSFTETSKGDTRDYAVSFVKAQKNGYHAYWTLGHWLGKRLVA